MLPGGKGVGQSDAKKKWRKREEGERAERRDQSESLNTKTTPSRLH